MKRNDLLSMTIDLVLAWIMALAGVFCLATGFHMAVDISYVALTALFFALLAVVSARIKHGWLLLLLAAPISLWLLLKLDFISNYYSLLHHILALFSRGYGWGVPEFLTAYDEWDLTLTLQALAGLCALLAGYSLQKCRHTLAALSILVPVLPCIVLTDTVPSTPVLLLAILCLAFLALTAHTRKTNTRQANRLATLVVIPLVLSGFLLVQQFPRHGYQVPDISQGFYALMDKVAAKLPFLNHIPGPDLPSYHPLASVALGDTGPRPVQNHKVMEVVTSYQGPLYLRGRSYVNYTGTAWEVHSLYEPYKMPSRTYLEKTQYSIRIQTPSAAYLRYFPYYTNQTITLENGMLSNEARDASYTYSFYTLPGNWERTWKLENPILTPAQASYQNMEAYLQLPQDTRNAALSHLKRAGIREGMNLVQIAQLVRSYVEHSADYNTATAYMPKDAQDFAIWFLERSETGYCVHFASAATVLLRAAGIPARYVEGFLVDGRLGQVIDVTAQQAHAWVEYYLPDFGWVILEATPSDGLPVVGPTEPPVTIPPSTNPTEPPVTTEPSVPTQPTRPTDPSLPTIPTTPTGPTEPTTPTTPTTPATRPTAPTQPPETTVPAGEAPDHQRFDWNWLWPILEAIGWLTGLAAALYGQWKLRLTLRRRAMAGKQLKAVYRAWRYGCMLARLCGHPPPKPLLDLLKKAKFSRNGLSDWERRQFDRYHTACIRLLQKRPWPIGLLLRLIFAAW